MTDENTILNTCAIFKKIEEILEEKGPFCSEEEFSYWFLSKLNCNGDYSLEYPFKYKKIHNAKIDKDNAKVDAILWDPKNSKHGLYAFEFKYAHDKLDSHGKTIKGQTQTISVRYDFLEDIDRLESLLDDNKMKIDAGYAIFLTNLEQYMADPGPDAIYYRIRLTKDNPFSSGTEYMCTRQDNKVVNRKYYEPLVFHSNYTINWHPVGDKGFYCCIVEVKPRTSN